MPQQTDTGQERTIPASPRRRQEARDRGQVAKSREVNSALMLIFALVAFTMLAPYFFANIGKTFSVLFKGQSYLELPPMEISTILLFGMRQLFFILAPFLAIMVIVAFLVNVIQIGFMASSEALTPKLERINPVEGLKRIFSLRSLVELVKSLLKIGVIGYVCFYTIAQAVPDFASLSDQGVMQVFSYMATVGTRIGIRAGIVLVIIAILDYAYQRYEFEQSIKMTPEEFKQEMREMEGDPMVRARIRSIQREMAQRRMMEEIPGAEVVITNPVEFAVALKYEAEEMRAPMVVAKGRRLVARKIREIAIEHNIPIVEDPPLARALYKQVDVGGFVPEGLYRAVAEVLAYIYRLSRYRNRAGAGV